MKPTLTTRFRCRSPLTDLLQKTLMFTTLILQYLNKLVEGEVGDLTSPQAFHTVKVQGFNSNRIKLLTQFACQLPVEVFALVAYFPIQTCEVSHTPPPTVRTFLLTAQCLIERPKFVQGVLQRLWVLFFLTRAKGQICVFHAEVCPNTLTCCRQRFEVGVGCYYVKPIVSTGITLEGDTAQFPVPLAVFMESVRNAVKSPFPIIPFSEGNRDPVVFQRPPRCSGIRDRFKLMSRFDMRPATEFLEKADICCVNPSEFFLNRLTWQRIPMRVRRSFQIRQVSRHGSVVRIRQTVFISLTLPLVEIRMHLPHIVKQVTNPDCVRLFPKPVFIGFHGLSSLKSLTPIEWVGRHVTLRLRSICLPT